ncbi:MAG: nucleotidyl transferase AbiEii/AbiGii toxin family protein [Prevotellaceae bacterium]|jgi:hypothetical protein|nr:nucleotidyl transferase AbiEii/AbiGii toxin family protein [Prevotellaceae bacterium]
MKTITMLQSKDREALFRNTAYKMGLNAAIIEKDFWVCWMLDYLFHRSQWKKNFAFKGGTSLSKAYNLIHRFSEDIDLILDWRVLGYSKDEPWNERSNAKQDKFNEEANARAAGFLQSRFMPSLKKDIENELKTDASLEIDPNDSQTIRFSYPNSFLDITIKQEIRLEIGALAAWTPVENQTIIPFAAEQYRHLFEQPSTTIRTVLPERTFWEKATILHREAFRSEDKEFPKRYSRHYYDLSCIARSKIMDNALKDKDLLERVVAFKSKFYRCPWARYDIATFGTMHLTLPLYNLPKLRNDYRLMQNMLFGNKPSFEEIMEDIKSLESKINSMK